MATPFLPTSEQIELIKKINISINDDPHWIGEENFCVSAMVEKLTRLQTEGIPLSAMTPTTVDAGPRYNNEAHSLLKIGGQLNDKPWCVFLDINQPGLLSTQDLTDLGYTIL